MRLVVLRWLMWWDLFGRQKPRKMMDKHWNSGNSSRKTIYLVSKQAIADYISHAWKQITRDIIAKRGNSDFGQSYKRLIFPVRPSADKAILKDAARLAKLPDAEFEDAMAIQLEHLLDPWIDDVLGIYCVVLSRLNDEERARSAGEKLYRKVFWLESDGISDM